jgi:hypothetical protein
VGQLAESIEAMAESFRRLQADLDRFLTCWRHTAFRQSRSVDLGSSLYLQDRCVKHKVNA